jgi:hypothetical protein
MAEKDEHPFLPRRFLMIIDFLMHVVGMGINEHLLWPRRFLMHGAKITRPLYH